MLPRSADSVIVALLVLASLNACRPEQSGVASPVPAHWILACDPAPPTVQPEPIPVQPNEGYAFTAAGSSSRFIIPAGAIAQPGAFAVSMAGNTPLLIMEITHPQGVNEFEVPATLSINYRERGCPDLPNTARLRRIDLNGQLDPVPVPTTIHPDTGVIRSNAVTKLSRYVIAID